MSEVRARVSSLVSASLGAVLALALSQMLDASLVLLLSGVSLALLAGRIEFRSA